MPSIVFTDLVAELISDQETIHEIEGLVKQKAKESERSLLEVPSVIYREFVDVFQALDERAVVDAPAVEVISRNGFRGLLD